MTPICTKSFVDWGIAPDSTGGDYSAAQMYSERRGGSGQNGQGERRGGSGQNGQGERRGGRGQNWERGEDEDREAWSSSFALGRKKVGA